MSRRSPKRAIEIVRLPDLPDDPDAVFVEDTALLLDGHAIITRPGAASRIGETDSTAEGLGEHFELHRIASGYVDGGDVCASASASTSACPRAPTAPGSRRCRQSPARSATR